MAKAVETMAVYDIDHQIYFSLTERGSGSNRTRASFYVEKNNNN